MGTLRDVLSYLEQWKVGGVHKCENGSVLVFNLPKVAPKAYLHDVFRSLDASEIELIEVEIERGMPGWLKGFYGTVNGINLFSCSISIFGLRENFNRDFESNSCQPFSIRTPNIIERMPFSGDAIFIGSYNWDGSLIYCSGDGSPEIYRTERDTFKVLNTWSSLDDFIFQEYNRLLPFFDSQGGEVDEDVPTTP